VPQVLANFGIGPLVRQQKSGAALAFRLYMHPSSATRAKTGTVALRHDGDFSFGALVF